MEGGELQSDIIDHVQAHLLDFYQQQKDMIPQLQQFKSYIKQTISTFTAQPLIQLGESLKSQSVPVGGGRSYVFNPGLGSGSGMAGGYFAILENVSFFEVTGISQHNAEYTELLKAFEKEVNAYIDALKALQELKKNPPDDIQPIWDKLVEAKHFMQKAAAYGNLISAVLHRLIDTLFSSPEITAI